MKFLTILSAIMLFAFSTAQASSVNIEPQSIVKGNADAEIKKLVQFMTRTYNLTSDQQLKVKEAANKMATDANAQKPIDSNERTMLRDAFSVTMSNVFTTAQYVIYKTDLVGKVNPKLDAVINAAAM